MKICVVVFMFLKEEKILKFKDTNLYYLDKGKFGIPTFTTEISLAKIFTDNISIECALIMSILTLEQFTKLND